MLQPGAKLKGVQNGIDAGASPTGVAVRQSMLQRAAAPPSRRPGTSGVDR